MNTLTIKDIDDDLSSKLQARAAWRGCSVEEEALSILEAALKEEPVSWAELASSLFGEEWGVELEPHPPFKMRSIDGLGDDRS